MAKNVVGAALTAALFLTGAVSAHAAKCATQEFTGQGTFVSGDICTFDGKNDIRSSCGFPLIGNPKEGHDVQVAWRSPETGFYTLSAADSSSVYALSAFRNASLSCSEVNPGFLGIMTNSFLGCTTNAAKELTNVYAAKGDALLVVAEAIRGTCGDFKLHATITSSCEGSAVDIGSVVGQKVVTDGTKNANPTVGLSCKSGNIFDTENSENLRDNIYKWTAPEAGTYTFNATTRGTGLTFAVLDGACPTASESNALHCQSVGGAGNASSTKTVADMTAGQVVYLVVKERNSNYSFEYDISITKDVCKLEDIGSVTGNPAYSGTYDGGSNNRGPACQSTPQSGYAPRFLLWTAPHSGTFDISTLRRAGDGRNAIEVRRGTCGGDAVFCSVEGAMGGQAGQHITASKGEQFVIVLSSTSGTAKVGVRINPIGCGDGVLTAGEECDFNDDANNWECGPTFSHGEASCSETCTLDTTGCFAECTNTSTCDDRPGAIRLCNEDGDCSYECDEGFADCDGDLLAPQGSDSNGCEVDLTDVKHCGACDQSCGETQTCGDVGLGIECQGETTCYVDADGDGYGAGAGTVVEGNCPAGSVPRDGDCDDDNATVNPGAVDFCNGVDDNCSGTVDEPGDDLCADVDNAVGTCDASGATPSCTFACKDGYEPLVAGDPNGGCKMKNKETEIPGGPGGPGDGGTPGENGGLPDDMTAGGGRLFGACSSVPASQAGWLALALAGAALVLRRRK